MAHQSEPRALLKFLEYVRAGQLPESQMGADMKNVMGSRKNSILSIDISRIIDIISYMDKIEIFKALSKDAVLVAVLLLCFFVSKKGVVALVSTGYTMLGYLNLPLLICPAIVLANRKISKKYLSDHSIDAPGID